MAVAGEGEGNGSGGAVLAPPGPAGEAARELGDSRRESAVVVAVSAVRVMQMISDEVVSMVAVRQCFVAAALAMRVSNIVAGASVARDTAIRIRCADRDRVVVDVATMNMMEVPGVQVVRVPLVGDSRVPASGAVHMAAVIRVL